jgi:hypothetical protein
MIYKNIPVLSSKNNIPSNQTGLQFLMLVPRNFPRTFNPYPMAIEMSLCLDIKHRFRECIQSVPVPLWDASHLVGPFGRNVHENLW